MRDWLIIILVVLIMLIAAYSGGCTPAPPPKIINNRFESTNIFILPKPATQPNRKPLIDRNPPSTRPIIWRR